MIEKNGAIVPGDTTDLVKRDRVPTADELDQDLQKQAADRLARRIPRPPAPSNVSKSV